MICGYDKLTDFLDKAELAIFTAGAARKPDVVTGVIPTREDLAKINIAMIAEMAKHAGESYKRNPQKKRIFAILTNPVDKCVDKFIKISGIPSDQVVGIGNILDQSRLKQAIHDTLNVEPERVRGHQVLGHHGDNMVVPLSLVEIQKRDGQWIALEEYAQQYAQNNPAKVNEYRKYLTESDFFKNERQVFKNKTEQSYPGTGENTRSGTEIVMDKIRFETIQGGAIMTKLLSTSDHEAPADAAHVFVKEYARVQCEQVESIPLNCSFHSERTGVTHGIPIRLQPGGKIKEDRGLPALNSEERDQLAASAKKCKSENVPEIAAAIV